MKKLLPLALMFSLFLIFSFVSKEEVEGIAFSHISLDEAMELAKKENKLIFIDVMTSWCGPCKKMAATSFKDETVAKTYNGSFINLKLDAEKSEDGKRVARTYRVQGYPTLLFINHKGQLVKQVIGFRTSGDLLNLASSVN